MEKIKMGVSACLLGEKVRYDGGHKHDRYITDTLGQYFELVPVCPEVECGLPVPREAMRLTGSPDVVRLVTTRTGVDHTERMLRWVETKLNKLTEEHLCGFIFKGKSPSSGMQGVKVYAPNGMSSQRGVGIFARAFMEKFPLVPVEDDGRMHDPALRENFIERVFVFKRWHEFMSKGGSIKGLIDFHTSHKLLILSHSPKHYAALGRMVACLKEYTGDPNAEYVRVLMEGMRLVATTKKNTNALDYIMGYFKKQLTADEKQELLAVTDHYHKGLVPLIVPITLLSHYVRKYDEPYLKSQYYLNHHPLELMLRNHV